MNKRMNKYVTDDDLGELWEDDDGPCDCEDNPDSWESGCIDDLCHGGEVPCMHGDYARLPCSRCGK